MIRKGAKRPENRVTRFPVEKSGAARIGGGERSEPVSRIPIITYDADRLIRNADFILIALWAIPQPSGPKTPSNLRTLGPSGRSILRTFPFTTLLHNLPPSGGHNPRGEAPSTLGPKGLSISLFHRASPGCRPCLSRHYSPVLLVSWLLFCCERRSGSRR